MTRYDKIFSFMIEKLKAELPKQLSYHTLEHILDVLQAAIMLAEAEKVSISETELLKVAVLFHDAGFIHTVHGHEEAGCKMVDDILPKFNYNADEIDLIKETIMATKFPTTPKSELQKIICDADLDYLGREDFYIIGNNLFKELQRLGTIGNAEQWNSLQVRFLTTHRYFTKTAIELREEGKQKHLKEVEKILGYL